MSKSTAIAKTDLAQAIEQVLVSGDLAQLTPAERVNYYNKVCETLGLNPLTKPFAYITLNGKLTLYATKDCTDQLRKIHNVSIVIVSREKIGDAKTAVYVVTARATMPSGRTDESIGAVSIANLSGDYLSNSLMRAESKSKRRVTLSICGLGMVDETETDSIPGAKIEQPTHESTPIATSTTTTPKPIESSPRQPIDITPQHPPGTVDSSGGYAGEPTAVGIQLENLSKLRDIIETRKVSKAVQKKWCEIGKVDNIDQLPDDLIAKILDKYAASTSVSK